MALRGAVGDQTEQTPNAHVALAETKLVAVNI